MNRSLFAIASAGLLTSCISFRPEPLNPAATGAALENRTLADRQLKTYLEENLKKSFPQWPLKDWDFNTLTGAAFFYHPSLDLVRAQWHLALGGNKTAAGRLNPTVGVVTGYDFSATGGVNPWIPSLTFDIPVETAGKRSLRQAHAAHLAESARLNIATIAWQVRANLRSSLLDFIAMRRREALLQQQRSTEEQIIRSLEQRLQAGAVARFELTTPRLAMARLQLDLADVRRQLADGRVRVAEAIGVSVRALESVELVYDLFSPPSVSANFLSSEARAQALRSRADILATLAEYAASQSALQLEVAKQYPDIHLGPGYQFDQGDHKFTLAISLELPVFNQNQGPIAEATARRAEAAARFNALQAKVIAELDHATAAYRVTQENLSALESFAATQREQNEAIAAQVKAGSADPMDALNSQLELGLSDLVQLEGRLKAHQAFGALEDALQIPIRSIDDSSLEQPRPHHMETNLP